MNPDRGIEGCCSADQTHTLAILLFLSRGTSALATWHCVRGGDAYCIVWADSRVVVGAYGKVVWYSFSISAYSECMAATTCIGVSMLRHRICSWI
jgi:hypothetical protein